MSGDEDSNKIIPTIIRHRPDTRTLAKPIDAEKIAEILKSYPSVMAPHIPEPTDAELAECPPSPNLFPLTKAEFGHDAVIARVDEDSKVPIQSFARSPVMIRVPTPALPDNLSPIPTPMALGAGEDSRLSEDEAAETNIWAFREALPPDADPIRRVKGQLRQIL